MRWAAKLDYWRKINSIQVIREMEEVRRCGEGNKKSRWRQVEGQKGKGIICAPHIT